MAVDPMVLQHLSESLDVAVRSGFDDEEEVVDQFIEQVRDELDLWDAPASALAEWVERAEVALEDQRAREATWEPGPSHNDRIDAAFAELWTLGVIALQDAGYTMSDGWSDVAEDRARAPDAWGAAFYHRQDVERAVYGDGLLLAFGVFDHGEAHASECARLANLVCEVLGRHGVQATWDGDVGRRIAIAPFEWRRRRP